MAEDKAQSSRLWLWIGLAVVLIAVFLTAKSLLRDRLPVRAVQAKSEELLNTVSTNGHVEPVQNYQFFSPVATSVKTVLVQAGDVVPAGKLLVTLDDVEARAHVATAESGVKAAQAALDAATHNGTQQERQGAAAEVAREKLQVSQAQHDLDALTRLAATGAASPGEVSGARQQLAIAQANLSASEQSAQSRYSSQEVARAQAALADAEAGLSAAQHVEAQTAIRAPIAGTIYSLDATPSSFAEAGKLLLQMADLKKQRVRAYFDEPDLGRLAAGQMVVIQWDAKPGQLWHGHIDRIPVTVITYGTRTVGEVIVAIDDANDGLLPDTNVTATVTISSQANALSIPREALHSENGQYFAYKIVDEQLQRTKVTIGAPNLTQVPILSGLKEGDWVATATTNGQPLQESVPIKVQK